MNSELPSFANVCATIQREETRRKVINLSSKSDFSEARAFVSHQRRYEEKGYKSRRSDLKCNHCNNLGHSVERCWDLHHELRPKFSRDSKGGHKPFQPSRYKANYVNSVTNQSANGLSTFTSSPVDLINEFASYLHAKQSAKQNGGDLEENKDSSALIGQFGGFLAANKNVSAPNIPGILNAFSSALIVSNVHDFWIIDSGAIDHITNKCNQLLDFNNFSPPSQIFVANGKYAPVFREGKIKLLSQTIASPALYVPSFPFKLLSVGRITTSLNCRVVFSPYNVVFQDLVTRKTIGEGFLFQGLYYFSKDFCIPKSFQVTGCLASEPQLWHQRLAHPSEPILAKLFPNLNSKSINCDVCPLSKSTRLPFPSSTSYSVKPFDLVHSDVWGPVIESFDGYKYFVAFVDDFSRFTWLYLLKAKSEVATVFQDFHHLVHTQFSSKIKILRSDNGSEYMSNIMIQYLSMHGIIHQTSCVHTPQQNGIAKRKNRDLLEKTRSLMFQMHVPKIFWSQGFSQLPTL
jgi:hypothetical protein